MLAFSGFQLLKDACYSERACTEDRVAVCDRAQPFSIDTVVRHGRELTSG
jgi:hypothetical protein